MTLASGEKGKRVIVTHTCRGVFIKALSNISIASVEGKVATIIIILLLLYNGKYNGDDDDKDLGAWLAEDDGLYETNVMMVLDGV